MRMTSIAAACAALLTLAACGDTTGQRAASGGLIGAAAGTAVDAPIAGVQWMIIYGRQLSISLRIAREGR